MAGGRYLPSNGSFVVRKERYSILICSMLCSALRCVLGIDTFEMKTKQIGDYELEQLIAPAYTLFPSRAYGQTVRKNGVAVRLAFSRSLLPIASAIVSYIRLEYTLKQVSFNIRTNARSTAYDLKWRSTKSSIVPCSFHQHRKKTVQRRQTN